MLKFNAKRTTALCFCVLSVISFAAVASQSVILNGMRFTCTNTCNVTMSGDSFTVTDCCGGRVQTQIQ